MEVGMTDTEGLVEEARYVSRLEMDRQGEWTICADCGEQAVDGACPFHQGDACLIQVVWKGRLAARPDGTGEDRLAHLLMWVRDLPSDVDERPAGMVKLVRHLLADMDEVARRLARPDATDGRGETTGGER